MAKLGLAAESAHQSHSIPDLGSLPAPVRALYEASFGQAIGELFFVAMPFALLALICVLFIKEVPLRTTLDQEAKVEELIEGAER